MVDNSKILPIQPLIRRVNILPRLQLLKNSNITLTTIFSVFYSNVANNTIACPGAATHRRLAPLSLWCTLKVIENILLRHS
eukprot:g9052.t1